MYCICICFCLCIWICPKVPLDSSKLALDSKMLVSKEMLVSKVQKRRSIEDAVAKVRIRPHNTFRLPTRGGYIFEWSEQQDLDWSPSFSTRLMLSYFRPKWWDRRQRACNQKANKQVWSKRQRNKPTMNKRKRACHRKRSLSREKAPNLTRRQWKERKNQKSWRRSKFWSWRSFSKRALRATWLAFHRRWSTQALQRLGKLTGPPPLQMFLEITFTFQFNHNFK